MKNFFASVILTGVMLSTSTPVLSSEISPGRYEIEPVNMTSPLTIGQGQLKLKVLWSKGRYYGSDDLRVVNVPVRWTYGYHEKLNIDFTLPWQKDTPGATGISYLQTGLTWKLLDDVPYFPVTALRTSVSFGGNKELFRSYGTARFTFAALFYRDFLGGEGYLNAGYTWRQNPAGFQINNTPFVSIAYQRPLGEKSLLEGNMSYQPAILQQQTTGRHRLETEDSMEFMMGVHYRPFERFVLSGGIGLGTLEGAPDFKMTAGLTVSLGTVVLPHKPDTGIHKKESHAIEDNEEEPEEKKEEYTNKSRDIEPETTGNDLLLDTANDYYEKGEYKNALKTYKEVLDNDKTSIAALNGLGNTYYIMRRFSDARDAYLRALELELPSHSADLHFNLGLTLYQLGERENALEEWRKTLVINPDHVAARENLEALE